MEGLIILLALLVLAVHVDPEEGKNSSGITCVMASCRVVQIVDDEHETK